MQDFLNGLSISLFSFDFANLFSLNYLLEQDPKDSMYITWYFFIAILFLIINLLGRLFIMRIKRIDGVYRVELRKFFMRNLVLGLILLILFFARSEGLRIVNMRLWPLLLFIVFIIHTIYLIFILRSKQPKKRVEKQDAVAEYQKYLPRKKKN